MDKNKYNQIRDCLWQLIAGTPFENKVFFVGGCCRDDLMGLEIKDIDMAVAMPSGGIRLAEWLKEQGHTTHSTVVYPLYQTDMFHFKPWMNGNEVMQVKGIKPGKEVRECLEYLLKLAFVNPKMDREMVVKHLRGYRIPKKKKEKKE